MIRLVMAGIVLGALLLAVGGIPGVMNVGRLFDTETMLSLGEKRIASVDDEFVRRSPRLRELFEEFLLCTEKCGSRDSTILIQRDTIVALEWPSIFPRLVIRKDWGEARDSRRARDEFFRELDRLGAETLLGKCLPIIEFRRYEWRPTQFEHHFRGFHCSGTTPSAQSRG